MALSEEDIRQAMKFYNRDISSADFATYLLARNLKFKDVEMELRVNGLISEIQKTKVFSTQEFIAYLRMGEIVSVGEYMHFFTEDGDTKLYDSSNGNLFKVNSIDTRANEIFDLAITEVQEVTVRFGTRIYFDSRRKKNGENDIGKY